jgi:hypothetical protein
LSEKYKKLMRGTFAELVEDVRQLSKEEKSELFHLREHELAEAAREQFGKSAAEAREEYMRGELKFSSSVAESIDSF